MARGKKEPRVKKKAKKLITRNSRKSTNGTFPNNSHPKTGPTVQTIIKTLIKTHGMRTKAARILHCDIKTITNRMKEFPEIQEALEEAETRRLDQAETMLDRNVGKGNQRAIEFFLAHKGKARGYGHDIEEEKGADLGTVIEMFEASLEAAKPPGFPNRSVIEVAPNE